MIKSALDDLKLVAIIGLATYTHKQDHFLANILEQTSQLLIENSDRVNLLKHFTDKMSNNPLHLTIFWGKVLRKHSLHENNYSSSVIEAVHPLIHLMPHH